MTSPPLAAVSPKRPPRIGSPVSTLWSTATSRSPAVTKYLPSLLNTISHRFGPSSCWALLHSAPPPLVSQLSIRPARLLATIRVPSGENATAITPAPSLHSISRTCTPVSRSNSRRKPSSPAVMTRRSPGSISTAQIVVSLSSSGRGCGTDSGFATSHTNTSPSLPALTSTDPSELKSTARAPFTWRLDRPRLGRPYECRRDGSARFDRRPRPRVRRGEARP